MVKRRRIKLEQVAAWNNLCRAAYLASRGKRDRTQVQQFFQSFDSELARLQNQILSLDIQAGHFRCFQIFDPKPRRIHAPAFRERVLHHALMRQIGTHLDRSLIDDTFACRTGKGTEAAVKRLQFLATKNCWFVKMDIRSYFASIDHQILMRLLERKLKGESVLNLLWQIVNSFHTERGKGLPIGALTSQHFANYYLNPFDRWLLQREEVHGMVRYMDDVICLGNDKEKLKEMLREAVTFLRDELQLTLRPSTIINRTNKGITFCSYRVFPRTIRLTARRKKLYNRSRRKWERRFDRGDATASQLQAGFASALGITKLANARTWRKLELRRCKVLERCADV